MGWGAVLFLLARSPADGTMKLGCLYPLKEFEPEWAKFFGPARPTEFYLPTERVICSPQFVVPRVARVYSTGLYVFRNNVLTYERLVELYEKVLGEKFPGTYRFDEVEMAEVWSEHGDDGHVHYELTGYRFVPYSTLALKCDSFRAGWEFPEAMRLQWFDYEVLRA